MTKEKLGTLLRENNFIQLHKYESLPMDFLFVGDNNIIFCEMTDDRWIIMVNGHKVKTFTINEETDESMSLIVKELDIK